MPMAEDALILLVEDDPNDLAVALRALDRAGLVESVRVLRDGQEALRRLGLDAEEPVPSRGRAPRVIFLDLKMPKVDGFEVLREIRASEHVRDVPVVVISSSNRESDVRRSYRLGANSFLVKRYDPVRPGSYLADAARYWIDLNRAPELAEEGMR